MEHQPYNDDVDEEVDTETTHLRLILIICAVGLIGLGFIIAPIFLHQPQ